MKKKIWFMVFLLFLCIAPMSFTMFHISQSTTLTIQPNKTKTFSYSSYSEPYLATAGDGIPTPTGDYTDTHIQDESSMFSVDASSPYEVNITLEFAIPKEDLVSFDLNLYGYTFTTDTSATTKDVLLWNGTSWNDYGNITENDFGWTNITLDPEYILSPYHTVYMKVHVEDDSITTVLIDYAEIRVSYITSSGDWYNSDWDYRKSVSINGSLDAGTDYQVKLDVVYDTDMQADFDDIRITALDGITLLDYWLESYVASTSAVFWVEIPDDLGTDRVVYMYFGNPEVGFSLSNGFETFIFFDDFEDGTFDSEWGNTNDWTISSGTPGSGIRSAFSPSVVGDNFLYATWVNQTTDISVNWMARAGADFPKGFYMRHQTDVGTGYDFVSYNQDWQFYNGSYYSWPNSPANNFALDTWYNMEAQIDMDTSQQQGFKDTLDMGTIDFPSTTPTGKELKRCIIVAENGEDVFLDNIYIRKWNSDGEPVLDSFGDKEHNWDWRNAGTAELVFLVPSFTGSLDVLLVFMGLVMIPSSTLFLAYSAKNKMSTDKVFYGLLLFALGWGLFIAGIAP